MLDDEPAYPYSGRRSAKRRGSTIAASVGDGCSFGVDASIPSARWPVPPAPKYRDQIEKTPLTFSSSSTWVLSAVSHICSTVIESRLSRKVSPALRTAGSITRSRSTEFAREPYGSFRFRSYIPSRMLICASACSLRDEGEKWNRVNDRSCHRGTQ